MEGNRPKRRKDKYNPYTIFEKDGQYYVSFIDGQGVLHKLEISKVLYDTFDSFELSDLVYLNVVDRHIKQSEVWESTLNVRAVEKPEGIEEVVLKKIFENYSWYHRTKELTDDMTVKYSKKGGFQTPEEAEESYWEYENRFRDKQREKA